MSGSPGTFPGAARTVNHGENIRVYDNAQVHIGDHYNGLPGPGLPQRQHAVLKSLSSLPFRDRKDVNPCRVPGTCEWFLAHPLFQRWRDGPSVLLWVSAEAGCGKSVLARHLIDHELPDRPKSTDVTPRTTCYFFFKDGIQDQHTLEGALRCLLYQLLLKRRELLSPAVLDRFETEDYLIKSARGLWELLLEITGSSQAGQTICVLDAVDECEESGRNELYKLLEQLTDEGLSGQSSQLKMLLTSRPNSDIRTGLRGLPIIHLEGETDEESNKIAEEIKLVIEYEVERISEKFSLSPSQRERIKNRLLNVENRTYLWAHLTLDLIRKDLRSGKREGIGLNEELPKDIEGAYSRMLDKTPQPAATRRLLHIILAATRPLKLSEVAVAMETRDDTSGEQHAEDQKEEDFAFSLRDLCDLFTIGGLKVSFLHQTVREFLVNPRDRETPTTTSAREHTQEPNAWRHSIYLQESHSVLAEVCISALSINHQAVAFQNNDDSWARRYDAFRRYAAMNWHIHARESNYLDSERMQGLCSSRSLEVAAPPWFAYYHAQTTKEGKREGIIQGYQGFTPVQIASFCGILPLVQHLLHQNGLNDVITLPETSPGSGKSALTLAIEQGFVEVVEEILRHFPKAFRPLLKHNPLEFPGEEGRTPVATAAFYGHEELVTILLREGAQANTEDSFGNSILVHAACSGNPNMVTQIIASQQETDPKEVDKQLGKSLVLAIRHNRQDIVQRVLDTERLDLGLNVASYLKAIDGGKRQPSSVEKHHGWPDSFLSTAGYYSSNAIISLILEHGADAHQANDLGLTALHWAVLSNRLHIVQHLLDKGLDPCLCTANGFTALDFARDIPMIQLLMSRGGTTKVISDWDAETRQVAREIMESCKIHDKIIKWLQNDLGFEYRPDGKHIISLLMIFPVLYGRDDLLEKIIGPKTIAANYVTSLNNWSIIHFAVWYYGSVACLQVLLRNGANPRSETLYGETATHFAASRGSATALAVILKDFPWKAINEKSNYPQPDRWLLFDAIQSGSVATVTVLLENGFPTNVKNSQSKTPLLYALDEEVPGCHDIVQVLVDHGADINDVSPLRGVYTRRTELFNITRVEYLLRCGANPNFSMPFDEKPLHWVLRQYGLPGCLQIVHLLLAHGADPTAKVPALDFSKGANPQETLIDVARHRSQSPRIFAMLRGAIESWTNRTSTETAQDEANAADTKTSTASMEAKTAISTDVAAPGDQKEIPERKEPPL